jgi:hypothetical protein
MTETLATPPATDTAVADLVLVRMSLPSKNPATPSAVRKDLGKLLGPDFSGTEFDELRNELADGGFLAKGKRNAFTLTDAGRERALQFLGIAELPPKCNWSTIVAKHLLPKAAGISADEAARLDNGDKLAAFVLKRKYDLTPGAGASVKQVLEAVACKELGYSDETTLEGLLCAVLSRLLSSERLTKAQLVKQLPLFETGLKAATADAVRCRIVGDWLGGAQRKQPKQELNDTQRPKTPTPEPPQPEPFDLAAFAETVRALAQKSPDRDRFHDNKVFIARLWRASQDEPSFPHLSLPEFKQRLIEANSQNLLHLSRADLVSAMDPQLVAESETEYLNATFHFVLLEEDHL